MAFLEDEVNDYRKQLACILPDGTVELSVAVRPNVGLYVYSRMLHDPSIKFDFLRFSPSLVGVYFLVFPGPTQFLFGWAAVALAVLQIRSSLADVTRNYSD
jgi:hypothetical protein